MHLNTTNSDHLYHKDLILSPISLLYKEGQACDINMSVCL